MDKVITLEEAVSKVKDGMTLMIGGFLAIGSPCTIIDKLVETGVKDLTIICNDTSIIDKGIGKLIVNKQVKKVIASHIGTNPETVKQFNAGELEVELVPQGTLAERIRCGGAGLGGILTPTGLGTLVEKGKEKITVDSREYLLEKSLKADIAIIFGTQIDKKGNVFYNKVTKNFNPVMATAGELVIAEARELVEVGEINPNDVMTPYIFVDYIVEGAN